MLTRHRAAQSRSPNTQTIDCDLAVVGGGMAGVCAAIVAARAGIRVALMQDRPVLGGNASSECRLWVLGATCHQGGPNRWARESGVIDEILVENLWRNRDGNPVIFESLLLEKIAAEDNITLLLNTACMEVEKRGDTIAAVRGFNAQDSTLYEVRAPFFCDASGDGIVGYLSGAAYRVGAEDSDEMDEPLAPDESFGSLLGHTIFYYTKDAGHPVEYVPPSFAMPMEKVEALPCANRLGPQTQGCHLWWVEYGGRMDTVHQTEEIKWRLWEAVYGIWNYVKNSGKFPEAENLTLEWVGHVPGKRESRRFESPYMLRQRDIVQQRAHYDAVGFGGWSLDLHPADGLYSDKPPCTHWRGKGIYAVPYRCLFSRNVENLFLAGRIIGASHVAFGSTRVMGTGAYLGQAVGLASAICLWEDLTPQELSDPERVPMLQVNLQRLGQHIPGLPLDDPDDLVQEAALYPSSDLELSGLPANGPWIALDRDRGQLIPMAAGPMPAVTVKVRAEEATHVTAELRIGEGDGNFTFERFLDKVEVAVEEGEHDVRLAFDTEIDRDAYALVRLNADAAVSVRCSERRLTGVMSLVRRGAQEAEPELGVEGFEVWAPERRPGGHNWAFRLDEPTPVFDVDNITNGFNRPTTGPNAWVADFDDDEASLRMEWDVPHRIGRLELTFDTDSDHALESVQVVHPERAMPFCVKRFRVEDGEGNVLAEVTDNHQARCVVEFDRPVDTDTLVIDLVESWGDCPRALFEVRAYSA